MNGLENIATRKTPLHCYRWGANWLDFSEAREHFAVVGSTGSGKTVLVRLLLQSVVPRIGKPGAPKMRALIYDAKIDMLSKLSGMAPTCPITILNPMDERSCAWDISADIESIPDAEEFAATLIPEQQQDSQPFFANTARALLGGIVTAFMINANEWTLRDVVLACRSKERLHAVLQSSDETADLLEHFTNEQTFSNVKATLDSHVRKFRPIAACWHRARTKISLKQWIESDSILVLGNADTARQQVDRLNRLLFERVAKLALNKPGEVKNDETWICLDEMREAGHLPGLRQLMLRGRSKGCAVILGFQDILGVDFAYPNNEGRELVGSARNFSILHLHPAAEATRHWASQIAGESERISHMPSSSTTTGKGEPSRTEGKSASRDRSPKMLASQFYNDLPKPTIEEGLFGVFFSGTSMETQQLAGEWIFGPEGIRNGDEATMDDFVPRLPQDYFLPDWNLAELDSRIQIPALKSALVPGSGKAESTMAELLGS